MFFLQAALLALVVLGVDLCVPPPALAYLDPGTGSMVFQWIIAGLVGSAFALRILWRRITGMFRKEGNADESDV